MSVRCFVGVPLPECVAEPVLEACATIRATDRRWRDEKWVRRENLHVTVKFLGDLDEAALPVLLEGMAGVAAGVAPFSAPLAGLRAVPSPRRARMLWASFVDPDGSFAALAESVERVALSVGVSPEERSFVPHATLCRARQPHGVDAEALAAAQALLDGAPRVMSVVSYSVFSSRLTPRGPIYDAIGAWQLGGE